MHAVYLKENTADPQGPVGKLEELWRGSDEIVMGFPESPPAMPWTGIVSLLAKEMPIAEATRIDLTYVNFKLINDPVAPMYVVKIYGVGYPALTYPPFQDLDRARLLYRGDGRLLRYGNEL